MTKQQINDEIIRLELAMVAKAQEAAEIFMDFERKEFEYSDMADEIEFLKMKLSMSEKSDELRIDFVSDL